MLREPYPLNVIAALEAVIHPYRSVRDTTVHRWILGSEAENDDRGGVVQFLWVRRVDQWDQTSPHLLLVIAALEAVIHPYAVGFGTSAQDVSDRDGPSGQARE